MRKKLISLFLVEDDPVYCGSLKYALSEDPAYRVRCFSSGEELFGNHADVPDIVILDYQLADKLNGLDVLKKLKKMFPDISVIMLSGQDRIDIALSCIKHGAYDYVVKNESAFIRTQHLIKRILFYGKIHNENKAYKKATNIFFAGFLVLMAVFFLMYYA